MVEALGKLLNISCSIESLLFGETFVFEHITEDLCKAIGQNVTL